MNLSMNKLDVTDTEILLTLAYKMTMIHYLYTRDEVKFFFPCLAQAVRKIFTKLRNSLLDKRTEELSLDNKSNLIGEVASPLFPHFFFFFSEIFFITLKVERDVA